MAKITPITATQDTVQTTTANADADASCETSALANGVDYCVIYCGNMGSSGTGAKPNLSLRLGGTSGTKIAEGVDEGLGNSTHYGGGQCAGATKVTGNGSDTLAFTFGYNNPTTTYAGAMSIAAIPLDNLTEDEDWFWDGDNSSTEEVTNAVSTWETQRSVTWNLPETGDYLIIMSNEAKASNRTTSATGYASRTRYYVGATELQPTETGEGHIREWEDPDVWGSNAICTVENLTAGNNTFKIEAASRGDFDESNHRRGQIFVFKLTNTFVKWTHTQDTTGVSSATVDTWNTWSAMDTTFDPDNTNDILHLFGGVPGCGVDESTRVRLYDVTGSAEYRPNSGEYNNDNGFSSARDLVPAFMSHVQNYGTSKDWRIDFQHTRGTGVVGKNRDNTAGIESNFIILEMETIHQKVSPSSISSEEAFGSATISTGPVSISPTGISSEEAFGTPTVSEPQDDSSVVGGVASGIITGIIKPI